MVFYRQASVQNCLKQIFLAFNCAFLMMNCGVEVGNPHGDEEVPKSSFTLEIGDAPVDELSHVYLNIEKVFLVSNGKLLYPLGLARAGELDILSLQNGKTEALVSGEGIPQGKYLGLVLVLNEESPGRTVTEEGIEREILLRSEGKNTILVSTAIDLRQDEEVLLHLDLRQSIKRSGDQYHLDPVITSLRKRESSRIYGRFIDLDDGVICAYLDSTDSTLLPEEGKDFLELEEGESFQVSSRFRLPPSKDRRLSSRRPPVGRRPSSLPGKEDEICQDAFTAGRIRLDGSFSFHFLKPGNYTYRVFKSLSQYRDVSIETDLGKGDEVDLGDLSVEF